MFKLFGLLALLLFAVESQAQGLELQQDETLLASVEEINVESTGLPVSSEAPQELWVVVYRINGQTHAVLMGHDPCCACLAAFAAQVPGLDIIDCGPIEDIPVPPGSEVSEEEALNDFGLTEWPTELPE